MPYPDESSPAGTPPSPEEELSGTEKHWNQIILAMLAIGTTVLGVTLAVAGIPREDQGSSPGLELAQLMFAGIALGTYWLMFLNIVTALSQSRTCDSASRLTQKRVAANGVIATFGSLLMASTLVIVMEIAAPAGELIEDLREKSITTENIEENGGITSDNKDTPARDPGESQKTVEHPQVTAQPVPPTQPSTKSSQTPSPTADEQAVATPARPP